MRYEGKTLEEALELAAGAVGRPADDLQYRIVEDKKSFWGARRVVVELITDGTMKFAPAAAERPAAERGAEEPPADEETIAEVSNVLRELLVAAELRVDVRHRSDLSFDLSGDDLPHLLARQGEGLEGLQTLAGRIAGKKLGRPVFPQLDADGFRERRQELLQESARRQAERVKLSGRKVLLDPMSPSDRRLVHLSLSEDAQVETKSEGEGFFKRVAILPKR
ncbi:MAG TPA: R3H domain-containing nucleic acid-binding protein [Thermoanaerobaculia bacterium]|jgi:spoIIIJ-associated protein|nr:R3H domain-containing nucleic acid-binding protein [Thermoanaerobaculia bacterium]